MEENEKNKTYDEIRSSVYVQTLELNNQACFIYFQDPKVL